MSVLWRRALLNLFRFPPLLAAIFVVAVIGATTAASGGLFLASTEIGSLREGIEQATRWTAGYQIYFETFYVGGRDREVAADYLENLDITRRRLEDRFEPMDKVDGPYLAALGNVLEASSDRGAIDARLVHRDGMFDHVRLVEGGSRRGVWIADVAAEAMEVGIGDRITLRSGRKAAILRIDGIYRHLAELPPADFWSPYADYVYKDPTEDADPPPLVLVGRPTHEDLVTELRDINVFAYDLPLKNTDISLAEARKIVSFFSAFGADLNTGSFARRVFGEGQSALPSVLANAEDRLTTVTPVIDLLSSAAGFVALVVAAAAGFYLVKRRRTEVATLAARGVGPVAQGVRYGVESILPMAGGVAAGSALAYLLVARLGPARDLPVTELEGSIAAVLRTSALALVVLAASAVVAAWREEVNLAGSGHGLLRSRWLQVGTAAALAVGAASFLARDRIDAEDLHDPLLTLIPVGMILAGGVAVATVVLAILPRLAGRLRYPRPALYLAAKRLAGASGMTRLLIVAGAWALGVAVYGLTMSASVDTTATAKAKLFIGSDFSAIVGGARPLPDIGTPVTFVTEVERAPLAEGGDVALLGIDPQTFEPAAFWDESFAERPLTDLLDDLDHGMALSTAALGPEPALSRSDQRVPIEVAATVDAFPGMHQERPTVIMSQETLDQALRAIGGTTSSRALELWGAGDPEAIERELARQDYYFSRPLSAEEVLDTPGLISLLWMLGLLAALGVAAAIIAVTGLLLYLQARQRTALVSSALTRRMGMSGRREFVSWAGEIGGALVTSLAAGIAVGLPVAGMMIGRLDPRPNLMPAPILVIPVAILMGLALSLIVTGAMMSWRVKRMADRADIAQVMRT